MDCRNTLDLDGHPSIVGSDDLIKNYDCSGIGYEMFNHMKRYRDSPAQHDTFRNIEDSYKSLLHKSIKTATSLRSLTLSKDPIVAVFAENHADTCAPILASHFLSYKVNAYDTMLKESDLSLLIQQIPPSVMFIDEKFVDKMEAAMKLASVEYELVVFGKSTKHTTFDRFCQGNEDPETFEPVKLESGKKTAVIMFSSGTTGLPKGICLSHNSLMKQGLYFGAMHKLTQQSVFLYFSAYNWITAHVILIATILSGASRVLSSPETALGAIHKYQVTQIYSPPHLASILLQQREPDQLKNDSVKSFMTGGSRLHSLVASGLKELFPKALMSQCYGQTEVGGWISMFRWHKKDEVLLAERNPDSVGRLLPGFSCKIVDTTNEKILGLKQIGEVRLKSECFFPNGFYKMDASDNFDSDGWLKTGDLGYYDENHCFYIVGRFKELLKYRSFQIRPQRLENILERHPAVEKAVVMGIPHHIDGEHPRGIVVLKNGAGNISPADIKSFVDDQVEDRLKLRGGVQIVEYIPMTSTGKPKRSELKEMLESEKL